MKQINFAILGVIASVALLSVVGIQDASAHQLFVLFGSNPEATGFVNDVFLVIGHTNEPAFGKDDGEHDGKHAVEIRLSDDATDLNLSNAELLIDKYYFENVKKYNNADSLSDADAIKRDVPIREAFGDPGHYIHRQVVEPGIFGYKVHGTIDYFGVGNLPVELTVFCRADGMDDPAKFESVQGGITFGEFGCVDDIDDIRYPPKD